jgi:hypothetical protein
MPVVTIPAKGNVWSDARANLYILVQRVGVNLLEFLLDCVDSTGVAMGKFALVLCVFTLVELPSASVQPVPRH